MEQTGIPSGGKFSVDEDSPRVKRRMSVRGRKGPVRKTDEFIHPFPFSTIGNRARNINDRSNNSLTSQAIEDDDQDGSRLCNFGCKSGILVNGNEVSTYVEASENNSMNNDLPQHDPKFEDVSRTMNSGEIWKYVTDSASQDSYIQGFVTQFNNESWLEVKRMSNFYQVDGEVMNDLSFKLVYKDDFSPIVYFMRGFSRLLKTGELHSAAEVDHLLKCLSKDSKLCLGLDPFLYQPSLDNNDQLRQHFQEKGQVISVPFNSLLSKACHGIVKINDVASTSSFTRGTTTVLGINVVCLACASFGKKLNQLISSSKRNNSNTDDGQLKLTTDSFLQLLRQPVKRYGMSYSALKYIFTQDVPDILLSKGQEERQKNNGVYSTIGPDEDIPAVGQRRRVRLNQSGEGTPKSGIGLTEELFLQMIDLQPPNSEGLGRSVVKKCNLCQFRAPTMLSLVVHMKGHLGTLKEKCTQCEIQLSNKEALEIHKRQMHTERSPMCAICQMDFTTDDQLFDHMNKHRNHLPFECPYCSHKLTNKEAYKKHLRLSHKITSVKDLKLNCKTCNIYFYTKDHLLLHRINQNHEGIEPFNCKTCAISCVTANEFRHHIMEHTVEEREAANLAICPECYKVFFSNYRLIFHIETKHSKVNPETQAKPQVVAEPDAGVAVKKKRRGPYLRYLRANEKYECSRCKRRFKTSETLENHLKYAHAGKKASKSDYVCNLCGRKFNALRRFGNHMKIHSGNRPVFQCEECGQIYGKKTQVLEHIRTDHAEQVERHQQSQELDQVDQSQEQQFVDIQVQQQNNCIDESASTSWSPIKSPFKVPTVEQTQEAVYSLLQLTDF